MEALVIIAYLIITCICLAISLFPNKINELAKTEMSRQLDDDDYKLVAMMLIISLIPFIQLLIILAAVYFITWNRLPLYKIGKSIYHRIHG